MDMETFVRECKACDVSADKEKAAELLAFAAQLGEAVLKARAKHSDKIPYDRVMELYNEICVGLPKACKLSPERKRRIKSCFEQKFTLEDFKRAFQTAQNTQFLRGENERGWKASFDFIIKPANFLKVLEGAYGSARVQPSYNIDDIWGNAMERYK